MSKFKFGTAFNCMDGRVQFPVAKWLMENYHLDYVDMITEPGMDKVWSPGKTEQIESLKAKALISVKAHGSGVIAIVAHHDCAGNPVSQEEHLDLVRKGVQVVRSWNLPVKVVGIWVNSNWEVKAVV